MIAVRGKERIIGDVSNPFRAGHWIVGFAAFEEWFTNPCFKPLQSGALDRSVAIRAAGVWLLRVSNPFRAGHWIVDGIGPVGDRLASPFQTPSERGIGS